MTLCRQCGFLALLLMKVQAGVRMPRWFGDHMVLQTNAEYGSRSFLNGKAKPGETVTISGDAGSYTTVADDAGDWIVTINPGQPRHSGSITVKGEDGEALT